MTTFNELLGTEVHDPIELVKQRYKLLSLRVHPDKGGTQVLMQLVQHAYENVKAGKGESKLTIPSAIGVVAHSHREILLEQIRKENIWLKNRVKQLEIERKSLTSHGYLNEMHLKNYKSERIIKLLEKQLIILKKERQQLKHENEAQIKEKQKLTKKLNSILAEKESVKNAVQKKTALPHLGVVIFALFLGLFFVLWVLFESYQSKHQDSQQFITRSELNEYIKEQLDIAQPAKAEVNHQHIHLLPSMENWDTGFYYLSSKPYILIKNDLGSYAVIDCKEQLIIYRTKKYLLETESAEYLGVKQGFHLYHIYSNVNEKIQNFSKGKSNRILGEYFAGTDFDVALSELRTLCIRNERFDD